jgi:hypothetical protein
VPDLLTDPGHGLLRERQHRPVARAAADIEGEVPQDRRTMVGVDHFGMKEQAEQGPPAVCHRGSRCIRAGCEDVEAWRYRRHRVAVAGPDPQCVRYPGKQCDSIRRTLEADGRVPIFAVGRRFDVPSQRVGHQLHAVADAEHRDSRLVPGRLRARRTGFEHAAWAAGQDDADRRPSCHHGSRRVARQDLCEHAHLPQATCDQLRVLRAKIEDDDGLVSHTSPELRACVGRGTVRVRLSDVFDAIITMWRERYLRPNGNRR